MEWGITYEVYKDSTLLIPLSLKKYCFALQYYELKPINKWLHTYSYAAHGIWGKRGDFEHILPGKKYKFTHHEGVKLLAARKDGCPLTIAEKDFLLGEIIWEITAKEEWVFQKDIAKIYKAVSQYRQKDSIVLAVLTDTHYTIGGNWPSIIANLRAILPLPLDGVIHLGDFTDGSIEKMATKHYVNRMLADIETLKIPFYAVLGNHDANYFGGNNEVMNLETTNNTMLF